MSDFFSRRPAFSNDVFIGRKTILNWIDRRLGGGSPQNINIIGEPRIGKTSTLYHIYAQRLGLPPDAHGVYMLLSPAEFPQPDAISFWRALYQNLKDEAESKNISSSHTATEWEMFVEIIDMLEALVASGQADRIIILIDDFDLLAPNLSLNALSWLRSLTQRTRLLNHMAFVIASADAIQQLTSAYQEVSPFYNIFSQRRLRLLTSTEATELLRKAVASAELPASNSSTLLTDDVLSFLLDEAGKHPALLRIIAEHFVNHAEEGEDALSKDAIRADFRYDDQVRWLFRTLFKRRSPEGQQALIALANSKPVEDKIILSHLTSHFGLLERTPEGFRLFSEAFEDWIKRYGSETPTAIEPTTTPAPESTTPLLRYDPMSRQVTFGDDETAIQLTRMENRLMAYLTEHANVVCSQENILANVWGPDRNKSVVEKTINRLRSKIEPHPSRPQYIISVWGHGYILKNAIQKT